MNGNKVNNAQILDFLGQPHLKAAAWCLSLGYFIS